MKLSILQWFLIQYHKIVFGRDLPCMEELKELETLTRRSSSRPTFLILSRDRQLGADLESREPRDGRQVSWSSMSIPINWYLRLLGGQSWGFWSWKRIMISVLERCHMCYPLESNLLIMKRTEASTGFKPRLPDLQSSTSYVILCWHLWFFL